MNRHVLFTFDYELFLGDRSGHVDACLLDPTRRLLELLGEFGFKGVFFIDTVYLLRLREMAARHPRAAADWESLQQQLTVMVRQGHYVFPHVHAHWIDAVYLPDVNEWSLKNKRYYRFSALPREQQAELFGQSVGLVRSVVGGAGAGGGVSGSGEPGDVGAPPVDAYRAGGWSIQPFGDFRRLFLEYGITQEWSVIPGRYYLSDAQRYDFRTAPAGRPVYRFYEDPCQEDPSGPFIEFTISTLPLTGFEKWIDFKVNGILHRLGKGRVYKGSTVDSVLEDEGDVLAPAGRVRGIASFEGLNRFTLQKYLGLIRKGSYFQFISHPKLITELELGMIRRLFRALKKMGDVDTDHRNLL